MSSAPSAGLRRAGLGTGGMRTLYILGVFSALKGLSLVLIASSLAEGTVSVIDGDERWHSSLLVALAAAVLRAVAHWATQTFAAREVLGVKEKTRQQLADRLVTGGVGSVGAMTTLATQGLDELDKYYGTVLPAMTSAAVIPLIVGARILFADWVSAVIVIATVPLIPVYMALIGSDTQQRVTAASAALARLSDNLVELARGLPVLVGLGRVEEQTAALEHISDDYRKRTMQTLRSAFMSSLALELISTISVAVVAVFIGTRLVAGTLPLDIGLMVLVLVPECYAPFRDVGAAFHASQDGVLALGNARQVIDAPTPPPLARSDAAGLKAAATDDAGSTRAGSPDFSADVAAIAVRNLTIHYAGRSEAAVDDVSFTVPPLEITALCGVSGSGKSSILAVLTGRLRDGTDGASVAGTVDGVDEAALAWVPQHPHTVGDTVRSELRLYGGSASLWEVDNRIDELLRSLGLAAQVDTDPAQLSPGELRRVAVARALLRVDAGARLIMLDEPTAHLDAESSRVIENAIAALRGVVTVIVASHEAGVTNLATHRVELDAADARRAVQRDAFASSRASDGSVSTSSAAGVSSAGVSSIHSLSTHAPSTHASSSRAGLADAAHAADADAAGADSGAEPSSSGALRLLLEIIRPARGRFVLASFLGTGAALFAISLTAVSGWLIVQASTHPPIMYLLVAIVGVRFFGIGRSVLHYAERLATHDGIFASVTLLRMRIWRAFAALGTSSRRLLRGGTALDYLVITADEVRDLAPRVVLPPIVGAACGVIAVVAVAVLDPAAVVLLAVSLLVCLLVAPAVALWGDNRASRGQQLIRSQVTRRFAALLSAADELRANGVDDTVRSSLRSLDRRAGTNARQSAWALGLGGAIVTVVCCATAALMLVVTAPGITAKTLPIETVAVLVLLPLGLLEPLLNVVDAVQQWPALAQAVRRLAPFTPAVAAAATSGIDSDHERAIAGGDDHAARPHTSAITRAVESIELRRLAARWPDAPEPVFTGVSARVATGRWLVVTGPSGSGKSTLLTILLGYLPPAAGQYLVGDQDSRFVDPKSLRHHVAWCPQEGHLFDSTLRANLLLARARDDAPDETEMREVLGRVGLGDFVDGLPLGLDTRIGSEGAQLSGGQRQRVAVARTMLTRAEVVLLDEPTAHLDGEAAAAMMTDLRAALRGQVAVLVTHHVEDRTADDTVLSLDRAIVPAVESHPIMER